MTNDELQRFCATTDEIRHYLQSPWRDGGFIYATNGHILVEIPDDGREGIADKTKSHPRASTILSERTEFVPLPELPAPVACGVCGGNGKHGPINCGDCGGSGEFEHGKHDYECQECDGTGRIGTPGELMTCLECDGYGEPGQYLGGRTVVGNAGFANRYLRRIADLPNALIAPNGEKVAVFTFDGGCGGVMPMSCR